MNKKNTIKVSIIFSILLMLVGTCVAYGNETIQSLTNLTKNIIVFNSETEEAENDEETVENDEDTAEEETEISLFSDIFDFDEFYTDIFVEQSSFKNASSPYNTMEQVNDEINLFTGDLQIKETDILLKGKNGLDFALNRYYNSSSAYVYDINEIGQGSDNKKATYNQRKFDIGYGWELDIPSIEKRTNKTGTRTTYWLHWGSNGVWKLNSSKSNGFADYKLEDIAIKMTNIGSNSTYLNGILTLKDGTVYKFDKNGDLESIQNRFGDKIGFEYNDDYTMLLITDTVNREISISKNVNDGNITANISEPNGEQKTIKYKISGSGRRIQLDGVVDVDGKETQYIYNKTLDSGSDTKLFIENSIMQWTYGETSLGKIQYKLISEIVLPTGVSKRYEYKESNHRVSSAISKTFFKVTASYEYDKLQYSRLTTQKIPFELDKLTIKPFVRNYHKYVYDLGDDGNMYSTDRKTTVYDSYQKNGIPYTEYKYDSIGNLKLKSLTTGTKLTDIKEKTEYTYYKAYTNNKEYILPLIKYKTTNIYEGGSYKSIEIKDSYDYVDGNYAIKYPEFWKIKFGDLKEHIHAVSGETELTTSYTYSKKYHIPLSKTYDKDKDTKITEQYTIEEDDEQEKIKTKTVQENSIAKESYEYFYNDDATLKKQIAYKIVDGVVSSDILFTSEYDYTDNQGREYFDGLNVTQERVLKDVSVNSNGEIVNDGSYITTKYSYDGFDNLIEFIDAENNTTKYEYNKKNQVTKTINLDNTQKSFEYIIELGKNEILQTDEKGNQRKLVYDLWGNLLSEIDMCGGVEGKVLNHYEYDINGKVVGEYDYVNSKSTYYTYDLIRNTLINVETRDEETWFAQNMPLLSGYGEDKGSVSWKIREGSYYQALNTGHTSSYIEYMKNTLKLNSGDYLYINTHISEGDIVKLSFKIDDVWIEPILIRPSKVKDKMYVESAENLGIVGKEITDIHLEGNQNCSVSIYKIGVYRGKDSSNQISNVSFDYDYAVDKKYIRVTRTDHADDPANNIVESSYIDGYGNIVKNVKTKDNKTEYIATYKYDYLGNLIEEYSPKANAQSSTTPTVKYAYDYANRVTSIQNSNGDSLTTEYDSLGRAISMTDYEGNRTKYQYDSLGRLLKEEALIDVINNENFYSTKIHDYDDNGNQTTNWISNHLPGKNVTFDKVGYEYNSKNLLEKVTGYVDNGTIADNYVQYYYDETDNLSRLYTGMTSPLNITGEDRVSGNSDYSVHKYSYDHRDRLINEIDPIGGTSDYTLDYNGNIVSESDRNNNNNMVSEIDRNNNLICYNYDGFGRIIETKFPKNDCVTVRNKYTYNMLGLLTSVDDVSYEYNSLGQLVKEIDNSKNTIKEYDYDENGNRIMFKLTSNGDVNMHLMYEYNSLNLLDKIVNMLDNGRVIENYSYNKNGFLTRKYTLDTDMTTLIEYNKIGLIKHLSVTRNNGSLLLISASYDYYSNGNQQQKTEDINSSETKVTSYVYDGMGRLTNENFGATSILYEYDSYSNRKKMNVNENGNVNSVSYLYDKNNRLTSESNASSHIVDVTDYYYDNNGNMISKMKSNLSSSLENADVKLSEATTEFSLYNYNGKNQLTSSSENGLNLQYTYDATGLRQSKTVNGVTTSHIWDGTNMIAETNGDVTNKYYRGLGLIYGEFDGNKNYYVSNAHGDVCLLLDGNSNITKQYEYDAFGVELNKDNSDINPFRYCGEYYDKETESIYLRARYYSPSVGRFITEDPIKDGLNWYSYANNNPIMFIDPSGLDPTPEEAAAMAEHIYDWDWDDDKVDRTVAGWRLIDVWRGGTSMKMGIYIPDGGGDWTDPSEYALVFRGSTTSLDLETAAVWANNILAGIGGLSVDMWAAINKSKDFVDSHSNYEITMVGHSKGGGEAIAAATKNKKNGITFNAANFKFADYGLSKKNASGVTNYYVRGEFLHVAIRRSSYGINHWLDTQYYFYETNIFGIQIRVPDTIENHSMDAVKKAFGM